MEGNKNVVYHSFRLNLEKPQHRKIYDTLHNLDPVICKSMNQFIADAIEEKIDGYGRRGVKRAEGSEEERKPVVWGDLAEIEHRIMEKALKATEDRVFEILTKAVIGGRASFEMPDEKRQDKEASSPNNEDILDNVLGDLAAEWASNG